MVLLGQVPDGRKEEIPEGSLISPRRLSDRSPDPIPGTRRRAVVNHEFENVQRGATGSRALTKHPSCKVSDALVLVELCPWGTPEHDVVGAAPVSAKGIYP
jgi:hypothetical protein